MFNKIKRLYFGTREVADAEEQTNGRIMVNYKDGVPISEEMTLVEWKTGKSDKPQEKPADRQKWFVERTADMRREIAKVFFGANPRYWEVPKIMIWVQEALKQAYEEAVAKVFGVATFDGDMTIDGVLKRLEETGKKPLEGLTDSEIGIVDAIRKSDIKVWQIREGTCFAGVIDKLKKAIDDVVVLALGVDNLHMRTDDIEKILKEYAKKENLPSNDPAGEKREHAENQP